jgi:hypothetical protein
MDANVQEGMKVLTNIQDNSVDAHVSLADETWNQVSFTGDAQCNRLTYTYVLTKYQDNGVMHLYLLVYGAPSDQFAQVEKDVHKL